MGTTSNKDNGHVLFDLWKLLIGAYSWNILKVAKTYWNTLKHTQTNWNMLKHVRTCWMVKENITKYFQ